MTRKRTPQHYLNQPYSRILIPNEDGGYSAEIMEMPGCFAEGATREEALQNLEDAAAEWIEASLRRHREIAEPFSVRGFSGAISLRMPRGLHRQAARMAEREGTSLNQYIVTAIAARVGADDLINRMAQHWGPSFTIHSNVTTNVVIGSKVLAAFGLPSTNMIVGSVTNVPEERDLVVASNIKAITDTAGKK